MRWQEPSYCVSNCWSCPARLGRAVPSNAGEPLGATDGCDGRGPRVVFPTRSPPRRASGAVYRGPRRELAAGGASSGPKTARRAFSFGRPHASCFSADPVVLLQVELKLHRAARSIDRWCFHDRRTALRRADAARHRRARRRGARRCAAARADRADAARAAARPHAPAVSYTHLTLPTILLV